MCACTASYLHYPPRFSYCNRLYALICFHIRTIPLTFRRVSVCVCLYGFASVQNSGHTRLRHPCLFMNALSALRPCKAFGRSFQASLPCLPLPLHRPSPFLQPSQKHIHRLAPHHILASLVKGRWIDGKAQALILLLSVCDTPTFFYLSNFSAIKTEGLPHHQPSQTRTIPCPAPCPCLPSKKGRWHGCRGFSACCTVFR